MGGSGVSHVAWKGQVAWQMSSLEGAVMKKGLDRDTAALRMKACVPRDPHLSCPTATPPLGPYTGGAQTGASSSISLCLILDPPPLPKWAVLSQGTSPLGRKQVVASSSAPEMGLIPSVCSQPDLIRPLPCSQEKAPVPAWCSRLLVARPPILHITPGSF